MKDRIVRKKRIAVISANAEMASFFEWEAMACGCLVQVFSSPPQELSEFDFIVLDVAAGYCFVEEETCQIAAVSSQGNKVATHRFDYVWEWPLSVETVREAYEGIEGIVDFKEVTVTDSSQKNTLYFSFDQPDTVVYRNQMISLTHSEWMVLRLLAEHSEQSVGREELSQLFEETGGNLVDVHICHLRKKLEAPFGIRLIETVRGKGYTLKAKIVYL